MTNDPRRERLWERGWEGHRDAQARRLAALSLAEKLDWLEDAHLRLLRMRGGGEAGRDEGSRGEPAPGSG